MSQEKTHTIIIACPFKDDVNIPGHYANCNICDNKIFLADSGPKNIIKTYTQEEIDVSQIVPLCIICAYELFQEKKPDIDVIPLSEEQKVEFRKGGFDV